MARHRDHLGVDAARAQIVMVAHAHVGPERVEAVRDQRLQDETREEARRMQRAVIAADRAHQVAAAGDDLDPAQLQRARVAGVIGVDVGDHRARDVGEPDAELGEPGLELVELARRAGVDEHGMVAEQHVNVREAERDGADRKASRRTRHDHRRRRACTPLSRSMRLTSAQAARSARARSPRRCARRVARCGACRSAT